MSKPRGSGYFAATCGFVFVFLYVGSFFVKLEQLRPEWILRAWLIFVAIVLFAWGIRRVKTGDADLTIGQDTINFVVAIVGVTITILALVKHA